MPLSDTTLRICSIVVAIASGAALDSNFIYFPSVTFSRSKILDTG